LDFLRAGLTRQANHIFHIPKALGRGFECRPVLHANCDVRMAALEEKSEGGELDAWELDYHDYLVHNTGTNTTLPPWLPSFDRTLLVVVDIRTKFEAAEYYVLNTESFHKKLEHHHSKKLKLWALRQQLCVRPRFPSLRRNRRLTPRVGFAQIRRPLQPHGALGILSLDAARACSQIRRMEEAP
jgi:hypothetical protein